IKDLKQHTRYIRKLVLASPCVHGAPPEGYLPVDDIPELANVEYVDLPAPRNTLDGLGKLPITLARLWREIRKADIVHTSIAGWPIPEGWITTPLAKLHKRFTTIVVESSFWRMAPSVEANWKQRIRAVITEWGNRYVVRSMDLPFFNQTQYRYELLGEDRDRGHVVHATWIDPHDLLTPRAAADLWRGKRTRDGEPLRLVFAGSLTAAKGLPLLLKGILKAAEFGLPVQLDIFGNGPFVDECARVAAMLKGEARIRLRGTVPYGPEFFKRLQQYHALIYPVVSNEQPRIIFDAYAQALPILASASPGMRECVKDFHTGRLFTPNDPDQLFETIAWAHDNRDRLQTMGMNALRFAEGQTHEAMHRQRWQRLVERLDSRLLESPVTPG
ncbi:MAG: glycosyltransferase, partial [Rhodocyclaceae bacterium]|nr:glycosyltransferase [Rhodocyclaceae bacterium]